MRNPACVNASTAPWAAPPPLGCGTVEATRRHLDGVSASVVGGMAATEILQALLGLVDFSSAESVRAFWRDGLTAVVNLLLALLVWFYHWRAVERVPADN